MCPGTSFADWSSGGVGAGSHLLFQEEVLLPHAILRVVSVSLDVVQLLFYPFLVFNLSSRREQLIFMTIFFSLK